MSTPPMAKPDPATLPIWAAWSGAGRLKLHLAKYARCLDCRVDVQRINEYYMVHGHIWAQAGGCGRGHLCIGCLEARIGRKLTSADFTEAAINRASHWPQLGYEHLTILRSPRFEDRLRRT